LAALLARRERVRSTQTALEPKPELFNPERPATEPLPGQVAASAPMAKTSTASTPAAPPPAAEEPASTTSRLLEAKRRAQKRKG
jgi:hypothetical protein